MSSPRSPHVTGLLYGVAAYGWWGFVAVYFRLIGHVPAPEILAHRIVWSVLVLAIIASTGANALYMTPLFTASSNHKYDSADYRNIDPNFGSNDDFSRLTAEAAKPAGTIPL